MYNQRIDYIQWLILFFGSKKFIDQLYHKSNQLCNKPNQLYDKLNQVCHKLDHVYDNLNQLYGKMKKGRGVGLSGLFHAKLAKEKHKERKRKQKENEKLVNGIMQRTQKA